MLRYLTAGESHGKAMVATIDGFPGGMAVDRDQIDYHLRRRQGGYGRGGRQKIETDSVEFLSGLWRGTTIGSPVCMSIINRDYKLEKLKELPRPRPGHGDLSGAVKYLGSIRGVLERASARETAARVAAGALAQQLLAVFDIRCVGFVAELGGISVPPSTDDIRLWQELRDQSIVYTLDPKLDGQVQAAIDQAKSDGDTLGGIIETQVFGLPFGLGSHSQWDLKLDGKIAQAVMSIQAIKGVEIGLGFEAARRPGSKVHDPIAYDPAQAKSPGLGFQRSTNNAGGLEAGMTNGQPLVVRAAKKPISTLQKPLDSINMETKQPQSASYERSDICAVPAASVIVENVVAFEVASALVDKFGGDSIEEMKRRWDLFIELAGQR